ncbi:MULTISPECIES: hypothetical protein [unclassified Gordonia (in: high G+C Gram-positive bacteria)]|uniref:hypothetical protein n=1 Tax=unclassified Gordonia (in: high G+C Gram-positive bacteria) TaxID=2657482 RepID=UPI0019630461|nr:MULTISPECIES: hypothetical protein [unclassified Gordonia (in: high G+C Gram-positive bacteria)]MBN0974172.1 hypothetical protein [Gordonia sp. BP-119]MBN0983944.1 hypothetical protein [Gordonia sp. BP-94]
MASTACEGATDPSVTDVGEDASGDEVDCVAVDWVEVATSADWSPSPHPASVTAKATLTPKAAK